MDKIFAIATNTFREAIRNKIIYSVFAFAVAIVAISAFFGTVSIGDRDQVVIDFGLFGMTLCGALVTILLGVTLLQKELAQKTIYNILSKPLTRSSFIIGKHFGLSFTVIVIVMAMELALCLFLFLLGSFPGPRIFLSLYFISLEMILLSALVLFFSSMVVTVTLPGIFALGVFIAGHSIENFKFFAKEGNVPNPVLSAVINAVSWVVPDLSLFNINEQLLYGNAITPAYAAFATAYALGYSVVALGLAMFIFERKEFR